MNILFAILVVVGLPLLIAGQADVCKNFCATYLYRDVKIVDKATRFYYQRMTWDDAQVTCGKDKGALLKIRNAMENGAVHRELKSDMWDMNSHFKINNRTMQGYVWLGGSDRGHEGAFKWYPEGEDFGFTAWSGEANGDYQQPDNFENEEHCVEISGVNQQTMYWNDAPCWEKKRFFCEYPKRSLE